MIIVFVPGLLSLVGDSLIQQKVVNFTIQQMEEMDLTGTLEALEIFQGLLWVIGIFYGITFIVGAWILKSVVFHWFSRVLGGEKVELSSTIHLIAFTSLPFVFKGLLDVYRGFTYQILSYEEFISPVKFTEALVDVFRQYSIFFFWVFILMVIAVKELYNLNNKKAFFVVLIPYTGYFLVQIILTFFGYHFLTGIRCRHNGSLAGTPQVGRAYVSTEPKCYTCNKNKHQPVGHPKIEIFL